MRLLEGAGRRIGKTQPPERTPQGVTKEARNCVDLRKSCRQERRQMPFIQRPGVAQIRFNAKKLRTDLNEFQIDTKPEVMVVMESIFENLLAWDTAFPQTSAWEEEWQRI